MHPRVFLVGLAGGAGAGALLRPWLFEVFPGTYVPGWPAADTNTALALAALGGVVVLVTGMLAARLGGLSGRGGGASSGALAGFLCGVLVFLFTGGAAAGVFASQPIFSHGVAPAATDAIYLVLVSEGTLQNLVYSYAGLWLFGLAGTVLGALSGWLFGGKGGVSWAVAWPGIALAGSLSAALGGVVTARILGQQPAQLEYAGSSAGHVFSLSPGWALSVPMASYLALLVVFQWAGWLSLRALARRGLPGTPTRRLTGTLLLLTPFLYAVLFWPSRAVLLQWYTLAGLAIALVFGMLAFGTAQRLKPRRADPHYTPAYYMWGAIASGTTMGIVALASMAPISNVLMNVYYLIPAFTPLEDRVAGSEALVYVLASLVRANYANQAAIAWQGLAALIVATGLLGLLVSWVVGRSGKKTA